jgi:hypothetical protein
MESRQIDLITVKLLEEIHEKEAVVPMADFEKAVQEMAESNGIFYTIVKDGRKDFVRDVCTMNTWILKRKDSVLGDKDCIDYFKDELMPGQFVELSVVRLIIVGSILKFIKDFKHVKGLYFSEKSTIQHIETNLVGRRDQTVEDRDDILMWDIESMLARFDFNMTMAQSWTENEKKKLEKDSKNKNEAGPEAEHNDTTRGARHDTDKEAKKKKERHEKKKKERYDLQSSGDEANDTRPDTASDPAPKKEKDKKEKKKRHNLQSCDKEAGEKPDNDVALGILSEIQKLRSWPMTQEKSNDLKKIKSSMECMGFNTERKGVTYRLFIELRDFNDIIGALESRNVSYTSKEFVDTLQAFKKAQETDPCTVTEFEAKILLIYRKAKGGK